MLTEDSVPAKPFAQVDEILSHRSKAPEVDHVIVPYQNFSIMKTINRAKFPVYLAVSKTDHQKYAMKMFFYTRDVSGPYYRNEVRFASLKHPNVINVLQYEDHIETLHKGQVRKASYILMEYAPHGDFFDLILQHKDQIDEKLTRTYFRQLIEGIEYLHNQGVAHLDLKLDNLLLGADYNLKIADFDLSFVNGDAKVMGRGTKWSRAPELRPQGLQDLRFEALSKADIYSAGIILFLLKSGGTCPHTEGDLFKGVNLEEMMYQNNQSFWEVHCQLEGKSQSYYDNDFRELFNNMVKFDRFDRYDIERIKQSKWYNGPIYNQKDLHDKVESILHH